MRLIREGYGSKVYATGDGKIVRAAKNRLTQQQHAREIAVLSILRQRIRSVAVPAPSIFIEPSASFPFGAIGYDRIPGRPLRPADNMPGRDRRLADQIACFIHELHAIPLAMVADAVELPAYMPTALQLHEMEQRTGAYVLHQAPAMYANLKEAFAASAAIIPIRHEPQVLLHGDLWYENMNFHDDKIVGIVDFEAVSFGPPEVDFMTQGYLGDEFRWLVLAAFQQHKGFHYDEHLGACLMFFREIGGLDYGIQTESVDGDSLKKIAKAAANLRRFAE